MTTASSRARTGRFMIAPALAFIGVVALYPVAQSLWSSFHEIHPARAGGYVALANYRAVVADPDFLEAARSTALFTVSSAGLSFLIGLATALALNRPFRGRRVVAALMLLPWAFPAVVTAVIFRLMLNDQVGVLNHLANTAGLVDGPLLLQRAPMFMASVLVDAWKTAPFVAVLLLPGLAAIPRDVQEAARMDGAGPWQRVRYITLPLMKPVLVVALLFRTLEAFRVYDLFWVMTSRELESLSTYIYKGVLVTQLGFSKGNTAAVIVFVSALVIAAVFLQAMHSPTGQASADVYEPAGALRLPGRTGLGRAGLYAFVITAVSVTLLPLLWILKLGIATPDELALSPPTLVPHTFSMGAFTNVLTDPGFLQGMANSAAVAGTTVFLCLALGAPAAYALARLRLKGSTPLLGLLLAIGFFPPVAILAPLFLVFSRTGLIDTYWAMILPDTLFALPLTTWLLFTFFRELPSNLEEAAQTDGATNLDVFRKIILPLGAPAMFTAGVVTFVLTWNEYLFANTFTFTTATKPATVVIADYTGSAVPDVASAAAAAIVLSIPVAVLVLALQRRIVAGLTGGLAGGG